MPKHPGIRVALRVTFAFRWGIRNVLRGCPKRGTRHCNNHNQLEIKEERWTFHVEQTND